MLVIERREMQIAEHMYPDSKVHGANMRPIWGRQDPGGPYVGPMNFVIWVYLVISISHLRESIYIISLITEWFPSYAVLYMNK